MVLMGDVCTGLLKLHNVVNSWPNMGVSENSWISVVSYVTWLISG